jgi:glycine dehydrogenase subunit 1
VTVNQFIPNTDADREAMLQRIGVDAFESLIANVPKGVRWQGDLPIEPGVSEPEVVRELTDMAAKNLHAGDMDCYLGAGAYDHYVPTAINHILMRSEFYTAYTPYQPEVSQGTLQTIYEYQTMIAELVGMEVANASLYDGGSAVAEAVLLAAAATRRNRMVWSDGVNPRYREIVQTYTTGQGYTLDTATLSDGVTDAAAVAELIDDSTAALVIQYPNYYGCLEDVQAMADAAHANGALLIVCTDLITLGVLQPPGAMGADIVVAEGQSLGNGLNFGGPYLGVFATTQKLVRKVPGRLVGRTVDIKGRDGYVLTLQTREQHIRREKATSNICTNQALCALAAAIYLTLLGPEGLREVCEAAIQNAHYLADGINVLEGFELIYPQPFAREFAVRTPVPAADIVRKLSDDRILPGLALDKVGMPDGLLIAVSEKQNRASLDRFVQALARVGGEGA